MLTPEEFRVLKSAAYRLEPDSLPKSELTGLYFNKHRPCWSVDYYSRQRKRKTIDFFVPVRHGRDDLSPCLLPSLKERR